MSRVALVIHGYGLKDGSKFQTAKKILYGLRNCVWNRFLGVAVEPFHWNSSGNFAAAEREAEPAGWDLAELLHGLEDRGVETHVVTFSLGAAVMVNALRALDREHIRLRHFRSAYLLGAAIPHNTQIAERVIPNARCLNYYSPDRDWVLKTSYRWLTGHVAAGEVGLRESRIVKNIEVSCTHCIGWFLPTYDRLAPEIAARIARN